MSIKKEGTDLAAVARVARNIDLRDIRVVNVQASCSPAPQELLEPQISVESSGALVSEGQLNVICDYTFTVNAGGQQIATASIAYLMMYEVEGQIAERDIEPFARANGVYHSWPFLRQFLFDLTAKMGFPPLTLPVFQVLPRTEQKREEPSRVPAEQKPKKRKPAQKKQSAG